MNSSKIMLFKENMRAVLSLVMTVASAIILKIVDNIMGNGIPLLEYVGVCFAILICISTLYICVAYMMAKCLSFFYPKYNSNNYLFTHKCKYEDKICCANIAIDAIKGDHMFSLNRDIANKYNLVTEKELIEYESSFRHGEIWIFSYDLTTEVLEDSASRSVKNNLKKGIVYREFYIDDADNIAGNATANRKKMEEWYQGVCVAEDENKLFFYPYHNPDSMLNFIFALFGIVLYIKNPGHSTTIDAYFSLRSADSRVKNPIYVRMPYCMTNRYYRILKNISEKCNSKE